MRTFLSVSILATAALGGQSLGADSSTPQPVEALRKELTQQLAPQLCQLGLKACTELSKAPARACLIDTRRCPPTARVWELALNAPRQ